MDVCGHPRTQQTLALRHFSFLRVRGPRKAREIAGDAAPSDGPYRVTDALDDYSRAMPSVARGFRPRSRRQTFIFALPLVRAGREADGEAMRDWHHAIADKPRQVRGERELPKDAKQSRAGRDAIRRRRATANRVLTVLKAALNHAWREGVVPSDDAWRRVSPFKGVDAPVIRYLTEDEQRRLVNACSADFREIVRAALLTGCRYGELIALRAADYNDDAGTITVRESKAGKVRHVVLTDEGCTLFRALTAGRKGDARIFLRSDRKPWGASHQQRPLADACARARISPAVSFHILRHSHGWTLQCAACRWG